MGATAPAGSGRPRADRGLRATRLLAVATAACLLLAAGAGGPAASPVLVAGVEVLAAGPTAPTAEVVPSPDDPIGSVPAADPPRSGSEGHPAFQIDDEAVTTIRVRSEPTDQAGRLDHRNEGPARGSPPQGGVAANTIPALPHEPVATNAIPALPQEPGHAAPASPLPPSVPRPPDAPRAAPSPPPPSMVVSPPERPHTVEPTPSHPATDPDIGAGSGSDTNPTPPPSPMPVPPEPEYPNDLEQVDTWLRTVAPAAQLVWALRPPRAEPEPEAGGREAEDLDPGVPTEPVADGPQDVARTPDGAAVAWAIGIWWAITDRCAAELPMLRQDCATSTLLLLVELGAHPFGTGDWGIDEETRDEAASHMANALDRSAPRIPARLPGWAAVDGAARP